jgi:protein-L-isoaspartate(D-aspartate) O-methyltransferase
LIPKTGSKKTGSFSRNCFLPLAVTALPLLLWAFPEAVTGDNFIEQRKRMVATDIQGRGITDPAVLDAMLNVPRHEFTDSRYRDLAYSDQALPIEANQTISQPYIVALMTQSARLKPGDRVLEVGTGSAYQSAVLAEIVAEVFSIEIVETLAESAAKRLERLGYGNVTVRPGDGYRGWKEAAPFDAILITAAAPKIPEPLVEQLKPGGRLVMPLGGQRLSQDLVVLTKKEDGLHQEFITGVLFVPMTGEIRK